MMQNHNNLRYIQSNSEKENDNYLNQLWYVIIHDTHYESSELRDYCF